MRLLFTLSFAVMLVFSYGQWQGTNPVYYNSGNVGIGTNSPGVWFGGRTFEILDTRPVIKLNAQSGNDIATLLFTNATVSGTTHLGEFHVNYQFNSSDNSKSLLRFSSYPANDLLTLRSDSNVGMGTSSPTSKLTVAGDINSREIKVTINAGAGPDYVFEEKYILPSLDSVQSYINQNKHLPEVPSAKEMEANGVNLGEMNMLLLKKVEELTLYVIEQNKKIEAQQRHNEAQQKVLDELKRSLK